MPYVTRNPKNCLVTGLPQKSFLGKQTLRTVNGLRIQAGLRIPLQQPFAQFNFVMDPIGSLYGNPYYMWIDGTTYGSYAALVAAGKASFSRTGAGTAQDNAGNVINFASGVPRETNQGLLIEQAATNLSIYSQDFTNAGAWLKGNVTVTGNITTAPDGTATGQKIAEANTSTGKFAINNGANIGLSASSAVSFSVFMKSAERGYGIIQVNDGSSGNAAYVIFNLATGTVSTSPTMLVGSFSNMSATIQPAVNGWWRVVFNLTLNTIANATMYIGISPDGTSRTYTGVVGNGLYAWGAQVEASALPTSYIPTTSAAATRGADSAYVAGLGGVLVAPVTITASCNTYVAADTLVRSIAVADDGSLNNRLTIRLNTGQAEINEVISAIAQTAILVGGKTGVRTLKTASRFRSSAFSASVDAAAIVAGVTAGFPAGLNRVELGVQPGGTNYINGYLQRVIIQGDTTDAQMEQLST